MESSRLWGVHVQNLMILGTLSGIYPSENFPDANRTHQCEIYTCPAQTRPPYIAMLNCSSSTVARLSSLLLASEISLLPPINLPQKPFEYTPLQPATLIEPLDHLANPPHNILLVIQIDLLQVQVLEHLLDPPLLSGILAPVALIQHFPLLRTRPLQRLVDDPAALVVLDVRADFANCLRGAVGVEVVVLDLEVFAERDEYVFAPLQVFRGGELEVVQGEGDGEVEGVVGCFVDDDEVVFFGREVVEIDVVFRCGEQVAELADLRLEGGSVEEFNDIHITWMAPEMFLEQYVY